MAQPSCLQGDCVEVFADVSRRVIVSITLAVVAVVAAAVTSTLASATAALPRACRVRNMTQNTRFATDTGAALSAAIEAARPGDRLRVLGTCVGLFFLDKDLTLIGGGAGAPRTVLDGRGQGRVVGSAVGARSVLKRLTVTGGMSSTAGGGGGIYVDEGSRLVLDHSIVARNGSAGVGGGIVNGGDLILRHSRVVRNHADGDGGGIYNYGDAKFRGSGVNRNTSGGVGGGIFNEGAVLLAASTNVRFNEAADTGGGILNVSLITIRLTAHVTDNVPNDCEGC
jgi:hypothetical protein